MQNDSRERIYRETRLLFDEESVVRAVDQLAVRVAARLMRRDPVLICMMRGGLVLTAALMRRFHFPLRVDYLHLGRYGSGTCGGAVEWHSRPSDDLSDKCVLLIDDICDQGDSLREAARCVRAAGAREVLCAVLVRRKNPHACFSPDYAAIECGEGFLIGWGMDFAGYGRNLSGIHVLDDPV